MMVFRVAILPPMALTLYQTGIPVNGCGDMIERHSLKGAPADVEDHARRSEGAEERARLDDVLEGAHVGGVDHDRDDVIERAAGGFEHGAHVADRLPRLLGHVALADKLALRIAREL